MLDLNAVNEGFSKKAEVYDAYCDSHPVIRWARSVIRREVTSRLSPNASILELNAGTGSDAEYFARQGFQVHATDVADGMYHAIQEKIRKLDAGGRFTSQQISFTELDKASGAPFDMILSNFGGLNCISDLGEVTRFLPYLLKPHGCVVWVIMPPICPWELTQFLRGKPKVAMRRLNPGGVLANVEGAQVKTWYFNPRKVREAFGAEFQLLSRRSLSLFAPPSFMDRFPFLFPNLTRFLLRVDDALGGMRPFNQWGDYVMYTFRYEPA